MDATRQQQVLGEPLISTAEEPNKPTVPTNNSQEGSTRHKLSCDGCRMRKVGCDRQLPCSRCYRMGSQCTYVLGYKARAKRQRQATPLSQLEDKVDEISENIKTLCSIFDDASRSETLHELARASNSSRHGQTGGISCGAATPRDIIEERVYGKEETSQAQEAEYMGDSSLSAHANFATNVLERAVTADASMPPPRDMNAIVQDIRRTIKTTSDPRDDTTGDSLAAGTFCTESWQSSLPPIQLTLNCLRMLKENPGMRFFWAMEFESVGQVTEQLLSAYSTDRQPSAAELIITYIGLYWLLVQRSQSAEDNSVKENCASEADKCRENVDVVLAQLPFHLPTSLDYILALTMATEYFMGQCKATTAWTYVNTASRMSQAMGLHRIASQQAHDFDPETRQKMKLFWAIYILEKNLSLQLGRSSTLRDHDITIPLKMVPMSCQLGGSLGILSPKWLRIAQIEGRVYDEIYSPDALQQCPSLRHSRGKRLIADMKEIIEDSNPHEAEFLKDRRRHVGEKLDDLLIECERVSHLSLMCLIYRSICGNESNEPFHQECINTGRQALAHHAHCMSLIGTHETHLFNVCIHWTLISSSFVPFFVLLSSAISTGSSDDLEALGSLIDSLDAGQNRHSHSASRLLKTFQPLYTAACQYIESRSRGTAADTAVSFEAIYHQTAPTNAPFQWPNLSALTSVDQLLFHSGSASGTRTESSHTDGTAFMDIHDASSLHFPSQAQPRPVMDREQVAGTRSDQPQEAAFIRDSQLGEWFTQSRYMMDLLDGQNSPDCHRAYASK